MLVLQCIPVLLLKSKLCKQECAQNKKMRLLKKIDPKTAWLYVLAGTVVIYIILSATLTLFPDKLNIFPQIGLQQDKQNVHTLQERVDIYDLQMTACSAAEKGGTCNTKLPELGFITPEECCKNFGKCC